MRREISIFALCIMLTGLAKADDEPLKFWELPYPEFSEMVPELQQAALKTELSEGALAFFVELRNRSTNKQWVVSVSESETETPQEPQTESTSYHCSTGDEFEFHGVINFVRYF